MSSAPPESSNLPAAAKAKPARTLPTPRIQAETQLNILRAYGATAGHDRNPVTNIEVAKVASLSDSSVSLCNPFWVDTGLLTREGARQRPAQEVVDYYAASSWDPETAGRKLAPIIRNSWFWNALKGPIGFRSPMPKDEAITLLADEAKAAKEHRPQLETILEYLRVSGFINIDGNTVSKAPEVLEAEAVERPAALPAPSRGSSDLDLPHTMASGMADNGMHTFSIPLPGKAPARISVPNNLDADDWEMLTLMLQTYIKRWKKFDPNAQNSEG